MCTGGILAATYFDREIDPFVESLIDYNVSDKNTCLKIKKTLSYKLWDKNFHY